MPSDAVNDPASFPFSAVLGMDDAKKAILCALVNPNIKCVLIKGCSGVAKSVIARSVSGISERKIVNVPLGVTGEQLFGGMDAESALRTGKPVLRKGLLGRADGNIVYFDDVNLADETLAMSLMNSVLNGKVIIEREGISSVYALGTTLIATMNPEEREMSDHIMDRFDICANSSGEERKDEVLRRAVGYGDDPISFCRNYAEENENVIGNIKRAARILPAVRISDELIRIIAELCGRIGAAGHRGDISVANTAMALAALNDRDEVIKKDVEEAAVLCLSHRRNYSPPPPPSEEDEDKEQNEEKNEDNDNKEEEDDKDDNERNDGRNMPDKNENEGNDDRRDEKPPVPEGTLDEMLFEIGEQFKVIDFLSREKKRIGKTKSRMGRRDTAESCDGTGRYSGYRMPGGNVSDIALDATIREAAAHQRGRDKGHMAISILESDLREKVRERRSGCTVMFLVDASGSIGVRKRMTAVKGAILSMLRESYVKRDRVGMMAFRRNGTEVILPPTRSVEYSHRKLEELPTGGKTPLGDALTEAGCYMTTYSKHHPGESCYVVLLTDGRANVPVAQGSDAIAEARDIAEKIRIRGVKWIVIDVSSGFKRFSHAKDLAMRLEGTYFRLDELNAENLASGVKTLIG